MHYGQPAQLQHNTLPIGQAEMPLKCILALPDKHVAVQQAARLSCVEGHHEAYKVLNVAVLSNALPLDADHFTTIYAA